MAITKNIGYVADARLRLPEQFKNKSRIDGLIVSVLSQLQEMEDAAWDVFVGMLLDNNPTGDLLDKIGKIVGQNRNGSTDDEYRVYISARIKTNISNGKAEELIAIALLLNDQKSPIVMRYYLKAIEIEMFDVSANPYVIWKDFLQKAKAAGDSLKLFFSTDFLTNTLIFDSVSGGVSPVTTQDPGSVSGTYGGGLFEGVF